MAAKQRRTCMDKLESGLYGVCIETSVITLTTISVLAITGELLIGLKIIQEPPDSNIRTEATSPNVTQSSGIQNNGDAIDPGGNPLSPNLVIASNVFRYTSLVIAALFLIEIILKIISKAKTFCISPVQIIDSFIVVVALGLEITFMFITLPQPYWEAVTYVVILRFWRIPYVCNIRADARQIEFEQEVESWRAAKQKTDEKCRTLQYRIDQYKLENMVTTKTNGHIPSKNTQKESKDEETNKRENTSNGIEVVREEKKPNGIIKTAQQNGHSIMIEENSDVVDNQQEIDNTDSVDIQKDNVKPVKSVNFDMSCVSVSTPSPSPPRHLQVSNPNEYTRTHSESSLSYEATEEEVVVQIENSSALQSPPETPTDDSSSLLPGEVRNKEEYVFENVTFEDEDDLVFRKDLQVMADIDGTKTYRSADGIPMTSL